MKIFLFLVLCLFFVSCSTIHSNKMSYAQAERLKWREAAEAGNAEAQFHMGNAWCCGKDGFFNTQEARKWWCKAAQQGHEQAQSKLKNSELSCHSALPSNPESSPSSLRDQPKTKKS